MIYAYGICEPGAASPPPARRGLGGARLRALERDGLAAVYSRHRSLQPLPSVDLVLVHERVVEAIMARGAVLPLRFGTQLDDEGSLADVLLERRDDLSRSLDRVRGHVELGLRVLAEPAVESSRARDDTSGRAYLLARAAEHRRAERAARDLHAPLAELAAAATIRARAVPQATLAAAYLVDAGRVPAFRARAQELDRAHPDVRMVVTGPWPAYSFTTEAPPQ